MRVPGAAASGLHATFAAALIAAGTFLPSLAGVFQFDDFNVIVGNPVVHTWDAYLADLGTGIRPLLKATYTLDWTSGHGASGFVLTNIAIHAINTALVHRLGLALVRAWRVEDVHSGLAVLAAALLFAVHPVQTEAVTYVSGRSSSLVAMFVLASVLAWMHGIETGGRRWLLLSAGCFAAGLGVKETAFVAPPALLLVELLRAQRDPWTRIARRQALPWALGIAAGLALVLHPRYGDLLVHGLEQRTATANLLAQSEGIAYLVSRLALVHRLNIDPALAVPAQWTAASVAFIVGLAALAFATFVVRRRRPWLLFALTWFLIQLAPTNSIVPRLDVVNERQLYLAGWGLYLAIGMEAMRHAASRPIQVRVAMLLAPVAMLAAFCVARQSDYRSEVALWSASVRENPGNPRARNNLGVAFENAGLRDAAIAEYERAIALRPGYRQATENLDALRHRPANR